ncbi:MAG TPA: 30S ribosomal protein S4 [Mesotoga infera]|jgi:small subunit ribosomal protein S4|uniref:Small ribosomal subunit protein uS4 n=1 Tax=Mesotoga infera TaxID=1236046 RepID=A0A7Z7PME5_9BACT|nr:30S ribosomal protein S4 [Mesotoga infera]MBP8659552.1 30S ribosomal protein S4 [Mesotoga sp.]NLI06816.1 30S ribosomal protein S4 [Thermotogaceae bacterium]SSC11774.1 30S ribosomal subunit protein S4 [Mesotoga infera]HNR79031.1 30S ribosomal protein S4 [Mesotoga infera]HOI64079.1 30S ribosomal protein S4 [Mesotoga sp.]
MARYTGPVCKLCRREGFKLYLKGERCFSPRCGQIKRPVAPGQHGASTRKLTQYGMQLRSKQVVKRIYGVLERQFRRYFEMAVRKQEETGNALLKILESRLDNTVFRMGFASSRRQARQLVSHGHVMVNGRRVNKPSFNLRVGDVVEIKEKSRVVLPVKEAVEAAKERAAYPWLEVNYEDFKGTYLRYPAREEVEIPVDLQSIIELYSK